MNPKRLLAFLPLLLVGLAVQSATLGTAFTYQGRLTDANGPANGRYDFQFTLYDSVTNGSVVAGPLTSAAVAVTNGLFTVNLDFGSVFTGNAGWLQIAARTNGVFYFTSLAPRQPLTAVPYATYAPNAGAAALASGVSTGAVTSAMLADGAVTSSKIGTAAVKSVNIDDGGSATYDGLMAMARGMGTTEPLPFSDLSLFPSNSGVAPTLTFRLDGSPLGKVLGFTGREVISEVYEYVVEVLIPHPSLDPESQVGHQGGLYFARNGRTTAFAGTITGCSQAAYGGDGTLYTFRLQPALAFLGLSSNYRIYQDQTVPEVASSLYREGASNTLTTALSETYPQHPLTMQFAETDLNCFNRLLEYEGIFYYFRQEEAAPTLVLGDGFSSYLPMPSGGLPYYGNFPTNPHPAEECLRAFQKATRESTKAAALTGYDATAPRKNLFARSSASLGRGETFEFDARVTETSDMSGLARVRLESQRMERDLASGAGNAPDLRPGYTFNLEDASGSGLTGSYVVTSVRHAAFRRITNGVASLYYGNQFEVLPSATPYRPARKTPRPVVPACTAVVVGKAGEEIWTDKYGRVKVQFPWDRYGAANETSSGWIRVATPLAGKNWGMIFVPRIGQEVMVEFVNGDPDQPVITGSFYNGDNMPPYALPANATQSGIKTRSAKGGTPDNFNEIRFEDKKGAEQFFIHAEKNFDREVENDMTSWVGNDLTSQVDHDVSSTVGNDLKLKVGRGLTLDVSHDLPISVGHNLTITTTNDMVISVDRDVTSLVGNNMSSSVGHDLTLDVSHDLRFTVGNDLPISAGHNLTVTATDDLMIWSGRGVGINTPNNPAYALNVGGTLAATLFRGSGASLTNLPATSLTGTLADARLSSNVPRLNSSQTFSATVAAGLFQGSGAGLSNLPAAAVTGTLNDTNLSLNIARLNSGQTFTGNNSFLGRISVGGAMGLDTLNLHGTARLNNNDLLLRDGTDLNHGLGWRGDWKPFAGLNPDGPVLFGCAGGALGTICNTEKMALKWDWFGRVGIDPHGQNTGSLASNALTFGASQTEGIASARSGSANLNGLDFFTAGTNRLALTAAGQVGIGISNPTHLLQLHSSTSGNLLRLTGPGLNLSGGKFNFGDGEYVYLHEVSDDILRIQANRTGIGRTPATNRFEVEGEASKTTAGGWLANSDARIKQDIEPVRDARAVLDQVRPVSFRYTDEYRKEHPGVADRRYLNVVAQEFREVFPEHVKPSGERLPDGSEILQVDTYPLTIYSAAAIRELNQDLAAKDAKIRDLEQRLAALEKLVLNPSK